MKLYHSDNTESEFDVDNHIQTVYFRNVALVEATLADDYDILSATDILGVFRLHNREDLLNALRSGIKSELIARMEEFKVNLPPVGEFKVGDIVEIDVRPAFILQGRHALVTDTSKGVIEVLLFEDPQRTERQRRYFGHDDLKLVERKS